MVSGSLISGISVGRSWVDLGAPGWCAVHVPCAGGAHSRAVQTHRCAASAHPGRHL